MGYAAVQLAEPAVSAGAGLDFETRAPAHERPVDLAHLARQTMGDDKLEREILSLFVVQSQVYLLRLGAAETLKEWTHAAHTIKGSAQGIGAWNLAALAEAAETLGEPLGRTAHSHALDRMTACVAEINCFIRTLFDGVGRD